MHARCCAVHAVSCMVSVAMPRYSLSLSAHRVGGEHAMQNDTLRSCTFGCAGALHGNVRDLQHFTLSAVACRAALGRPDNRGYAQRVHGCIQASAAERNPPKLLPSPGADVAPVPAQSQRGLPGFTVFGRCGMLVRL